MSASQKYVKLTEIEHCLKRPGRYIGAITPETRETYTIVDGELKYRKVTFSPAFIKLFDEIISNPIDHSHTKEGKHLNMVMVNVDADGYIEVIDNGGIPVVKHEEYDQYIPDLIFSELRTGSNFDDDSDLISTGQNGEGASLVNIFSKEFTVATCDGKLGYTRTYYNNLSSASKEVISTCNGCGTSIKWLTDFERFGITMDQDHRDMIETRVYEMAALAPHITFFFNKKEIKVNSFEKFIKLFDEEPELVIKGDWNIGILPSFDGFKHTSFVNTTHTFLGGAHLDIIMDDIVKKVRPYIEKKAKASIKPSEIKAHFHLFVDATIMRPRYNSQTKEFLINDASEINESYQKISAKLTEKVLTKLPLITNIIEWLENKTLLEEKAKHKKKIKNKSSLRDLVKYETANAKDRSKCTLWIAEGDSAATPIIAARDAEYHGVFPLKGKPINVIGTSLRKVVANVEFNNLCRILNVEIGEPIPMKDGKPDLRYGRVVIASDSDYDGYHIRGLLVAMFYKFFPILFEYGVICILQTPIIKAVCKKKNYEFFTIAEFEEWEKNHTASETTYLKGLGGNSTADFKRYLRDDRFVEVIDLDEEGIKALELAFNPKRANDRKRWLVDD